jgi:hypothetical protein
MAAVLLHLKDCAEPDKKIAILQDKFLKRKLLTERKGSEN